MNIERVMILWNSARKGGNGEIRVVEHPDDRGNYQNDRMYLKSAGACDVQWRQIDNERRIVALFKLYHQITLRDGLDPASVHAEFCKIQEFSNAARSSMYPHGSSEALDRMRANFDVSHA